MMHSQHWLGLQGKVCAVTGAASGIGAEVARQLAQAGAKVALLDRNAAGCADIASELTAQGAQVLVVPCDIADEPQTLAAAKAVEQQWGQCNALINNAVIASKNCNHGSIYLRRSAILPSGKPFNKFFQPP